MSPTDTIRVIVVLTTTTLAACSATSGNMAVRVITTEGDSVPGVVLAIKHPKLVSAEFETDAEGRATLAWPHATDPHFVELRRNGFVERLLKFQPGRSIEISLPRDVPSQPMDPWWKAHIEKRLALGMSSSTLDESLGRAPSRVCFDHDQDYYLARWPHRERRISGHVRIYTLGGWDAVLYAWFTESDRLEDFFLAPYSYETIEKLRRAER